MTKEIQNLVSMFVQLGISQRDGLLTSIEAKSMLIEETKVKQFKDNDLDDLRKEIAIDKSQVTNLDMDGVLNYKGRICAPRVDDLILRLPMKDHGSRYSIHMGVTKMYRDLKQFYWWSYERQDIVKFVAMCEHCQQLKYEHQRPVVLLQNMSIPQ